MKLEQEATDEKKLQASALIFIAPEQFSFLENFLLAQENHRMLLDMFFVKMKKLFSQVYTTDVPFLSAYAQEYTLEVLPQDSEIALMNQIWKKNSSSVALIDAVAPLLDEQSVRELFAIHENYLAEFTYAENLPAGMGVDFFSPGFLKTFHYVHNSKEEYLSSFHHIAAYAKKNIQKFHSEIHFVEPDMRNYRLQFTLNKKRNYHLVTNILEQKADMQFKHLDDFLNANPNIMALKPAYLEIELTSACEYSCSFCPRTFVQDPLVDMDSSLLLTRLKEFKENSFGDTAIAFGGMGEPLQHPQIKEILQELYKMDEDTNAFSFVLLETNGLHLHLLADAEKQLLQKMRIIVNINGIQNYADIHGSSMENFETVRANMQMLKERYAALGLEAKEHIWIQTLKMEENEQEIDALFELSDSLQVSFLLQKYNRFLFMPEKRLSDMTPLERFFCWHLARDLYIRADGSVAFCKQDVQNKCLVSSSEDPRADSLKEKSIEEIFASRKKYFEKNFHGDYSFCQCEQCDEYYTFNN